MANDWFIKINNAEHGPLTSDKLKQLAQQGKVTPETFVKKGASGTWLQANHVTGLFPMAASAGAPTTAASLPKPDSPPNVPTATARPAVPSQRQNVPTALPPTPALPPVAEKKDNLVRNVGIAAGAIAVVIIALLVVPDMFRDKWELNNAHRVLAKLKEADGLQKSDPVAAYKIYDDVLKEAKQHKTTDLLTDELASAEKAQTALHAKVEDKIRAEEAEKQRHVDEETRPANEEKQRISAPTGYVIRMYGESQAPYLDDVDVPLTWTKTKKLAHRFPTKEEAERFVTELRRTLAISHAQRQLSDINGFGVESVDSDSNSTGGGAIPWGGLCCVACLAAPAICSWWAWQRGNRMRLQRANRMRHCPICEKENLAIGEGLSALRPPASMNATSRRLFAAS